MRIHRQGRNVVAVATPATVSPVAFRALTPYPEAKALEDVRGKSRSHASVADK